MLAPPFDRFPELIGSTITLRQVQEADVPDILDISFFDGYLAVTAEEARAIIQRIHETYLHGTAIHWGIASHKNNQIVGTCGYYRGFAADAGELGFILKAEHQGNGYMREALTLAINYGLHSLQLKRIWARTAHNNLAAIGLLERLGFVKKERTGDWLIYDYENR
ncbi:GNAT family N-acetyltransferase [Sphingobacterium humi]|uniref:GNAT family N-acetyltransferase n=1 Tax=Sphingobacterium humi TaxID=1796905 RepID=A0A6N8KTM2_9SPHI|nr:GNAT family N-acetyltransferase [Sphingobacterium humi]MVZ60793.1 GNAT family N-acetyltransferase [Sphingobacterium humi]